MAYWYRCKKEKIPLVMKSFGEPDFVAFFFSRHLWMGLTPQSSREKNSKDSNKKI